MVGRLSIKLFYAGLCAIAVVGSTAIWMASRSSASPTVEVLDSLYAMEASAFPGYVLGSDSAPVEIVEYADFACSACATFTILQGPDVRSRLVATGLARLRFRGFALYEVSLLPLGAAACAGEQGHFWEMHDQLMFNQYDWYNDPNWATARRTRRLFREYADNAGVDLNAYDQCMDEERYTARILATRDEIVSMGIYSTPTFDIGSWRLVGAAPYDSVKALVERAAGIRP